MERGVEVRVAPSPFRVSFSVAKGLGRLLAPGLGLRAYERVAPERAWEFRLAGAFGLALAGLCAAAAFRR